MSDDKDRLDKIITRGGDKGETALGGGQRVPKDSLRLETYGTVDELNSFVGLARRHPDLHESLKGPLETIQQDLFALGGELCFETDDIKKYDIKQVSADRILQLEVWAEEKNNLLPPLKEFILPTGPGAAAELHVCRTVCRRAERLAVTLQREQKINIEIIKYLNRLSDLFFIYARWAQIDAGENPVMWDRSG
jgi:cob(I)alamin adenosyltransferase